MPFNFNAKASKKPGQTKKGFGATAGKTAYGKFASASKDPGKKAAFGKFAAGTKAPGKFGKGAGFGKTMKKFAK